ncbi:MAG TPA: HlyD family efflux transporter periplasmic adaptor subunit [Verrucomicrobiae bacterium]|jgi:HlyD family secretion protein|nr:HlyD family efflux transporter periplasmic adaptor subunit [Verrucomicrobiae bacterium]
MDIVRDESVKRKRRIKQMVIAAAGVIVLAGGTVALFRLPQAAPSVERGTVWPDTVKRGPMLRQVHGIGTLVPIPADIRLIPAETDVRVERILELPGTVVKADTVIMELSNPQVDQEAMDADLQVKSAEADYQNTRVKVNSDLKTLQAGAATVEADYENAKRDADNNRELVKIGVLSEATLKTSLAKEREMATRLGIEQERIKDNTAAITTQLAVQQANIDQKHALAKLKNRNKDSLKVRAGINGVLQEVPVTVGQRVVQGTILAKVVDPDHLKAELKIPETQVKDVTIGQIAEVDTHNGIIKGKVIRRDPSVINGTVVVDIQLEGQLPKGSVPDLSVDGTITLERLENVLFVGRPAFGQEKSTVVMFKVLADGTTAVRVPVELGRMSVNSVEIVRGLQEGDQVILSDMSRYDNVDRIKLN